MVELHNNGLVIVTQDHTMGWSPECDACLLALAMLDGLVPQRLLGPNIMAGVIWRGVRGHDLVVEPAWITWTKKDRATGPTMALATTRAPQSAEATIRQFANLIVAGRDDEGQSAF